MNVWIFYWHLGFYLSESGVLDEIFTTNNFQAGAQTADPRSCVGLKFCVESFVFFWSSILIVVNWYWLLKHHLCQINCWISPSESICWIQGTKTLAKYFHHSLTSSHKTLVISRLKTCPQDFHWLSKALKEINIVLSISSLPSWFCLGVESGGLFLWVSC